MLGAALLGGLAWCAGWPWLPAWIGSLSLTTLAAFGIDKRQARRAGRRRVPEKELLLLALLGGSPGAFAAMSLFRHKSIKRSFRRWMAAVALAQLLGLALWLARDRL
ncbi:MAG: DUF1294 domain-containing protein [Verrucomicrobia bacterium]|nr:MAG: DUF1294 domain-containing protein [Verrucomicrobiota bacterium]